jgi:glycosyltransferase involved in cell wall biosynthesis
MRICHLISGDLWAGAEVMAFNLLRELRKLPNLDLSVIIFNEGRLAEELNGQKIALWVLDEHRESFPRIVLKVRALLRKRLPQIIHSHRYKENILAFLGKSPRTKMVATQHGMPETRNGIPRFSSRLVERINGYLLSRCFDRVVGVSWNIEDYFLNCGFKPDRLRVINNGIEIPDLLPRKDRQTIVVGSAGRLFPVKDYPLMVEIARIVSTKSAPVQFELAGDGPERHRLERLIATRGVSESFRLCGYIAQMDSFYVGIDVYLNTSLHEGIPMSILEGMARGLPVIAPKVGGIAEIIEDGVEGFLVDGRNPEEFAEKCVMLQNSELRHRMGRAARAKIEKAFSAQAMAQQYHRLYCELAAP